MCDYNISFYDIEHDGVINYQSAYQLIQHSIDGLSPPIMSSSSSSQASTTISPTPLESPTIDQHKRMICKQPLMNINFIY